jgi:hypothetical protein
LQALKAKEILKVFFEWEVKEIDGSVVEIECDGSVFVVELMMTLKNIKFDVISQRLQTSQLTSIFFFDLDIYDCFHTAMTSDLSLDTSYSRIHKAIVLYLDYEFSCDMNLIYLALRDASSTMFLRTYLTRERIDVHRK